MTAAPVNVFISYTRDDNDGFDGIVSALHARLLAFLRANVLDEPVRVYMDIKSNPLGDDWTELERMAVEDARIFIPVVTTNWLRSPECGKEFRQFRECMKTSRELRRVLPLLLAGHAVIRNSARDEARYVATHQYADMEGPCIAGAKSSIFVDLVHRLGHCVLQIYGYESTS